MPLSFFEIVVLTKLTAPKTLLPKYFLLFLSLFSNASYVPVDAPDGQIADALKFLNKPLLQLLDYLYCQKLDELLSLRFYSFIS